MFENKHQKDSARITVLITLIILLLLFVMGPKYLDPPDEYGVAVNFGVQDYGKGNIQPTKPIAPEKQSVEDIKNTETPEPEKSESKPVEQTEELLTQDTEEALTIKKKQEEEAKKKAEAERIEQEKRQAEEKKKKEQEAKKNSIDNLIDGIGKNQGEDKGGEGDDIKESDKGQIDGSPYAPSYFGDSRSGSGGVKFGLNGRGNSTFTKIVPNCNEYGRVVVRIEVDKNGKVIKATPGVKGTQNSAKCLLEPARKIAMSGKWKADPKAPSRQIGFVSINFEISQ